ncbi:unnamed protein product [Prunus armeniaca]
MNKWPTNSQQRLVQNDVVLARQFKKKEKEKSRAAHSAQQHSSPSFAHFIEHLPCMSRGATSAASMEFSDDRRCRCTSLRLHRSATTLVCSVVLLLYNEWTMSSYRRLILTVGMRCSSLMWVYSVGA